MSLPDQLQIFFELLLEHIAGRTVPPAGRTIYGTGWTVRPRVQAACPTERTVDAMGRTVCCMGWTVRPAGQTAHESGRTVRAGL